MTIRKRLLPYLASAVLALTSCVSYTDKLESLLVDASRERTEMARESIGKPDLSMTIKELNLDGYHMAVYEYSKQSPTGILLHHLGGKHEDYDDLAKFVCSQGYNLVCIDLPGWGKTKEQHEKFTIEECFECTEIAENWIEQNYSLNKLFGIGMSAGADILVYRALKTGKYSAVIAQSPMLNSIDPLDWRVKLARTRFGRPFIYIIKGDSIPLKELFTPVDLVLELTESLLKILSEESKQEVDLPGLCGLVYYNEQTPLHTLPPTLIMAGADDKLIPRQHEIEVVYELRRRGAKRVSLIVPDDTDRLNDNGSHLLLMEYPDRFGCLAVDFLDRNLKSRK